MPTNTIDWENEHPVSPARMTSSFLSMVSQSARAQATHYTLFIAGHGAEAPLVQSYLDAIAVFDSHLREWAGNHTISTIRAHLPHADTLFPTGQSHDHPGTMPPVPAAVSIVCTLALQQKIRRTSTPNDTKLRQTALDDDFDSPESIDGVLDTLSLWNKPWRTTRRTR